MRQQTAGSTIRTGRTGPTGCPRSLHHSEILCEVSQDEWLNMVELKVAIQRDLEKQKQEKRVFKELAEPIASEAME